MDKIVQNIKMKIFKQILTFVHNFIYFLSYNHVALQEFVMPYNGPNITKKEKRKKIIHNKSQ